MVDIFLRQMASLCSSRQVTKYSDYHRNCQVVSSQVLPWSSQVLGWIGVVVVVPVGGVVGMLGMLQPSS